MPSLRDVRRRIRSVENTQKITKAMQVVSATRLRRAQQAVQATRPYADKMREVLQTTAERASEYRHPYLQPREGNRALVILITSDQGLCGALNTNTIRAVNEQIRQRHENRARFVAIGRKGRDFLARYRRDLVAEVTGLRDRPGVASVLPPVRAALDEFDQERVDVVLLAFARWVSTLRQEPEIRTLIPVEIPGEIAGHVSADYLYEPDPETVLDALLPRYIETQVYQALLENQASFHSARMIAMQNATNAAGDLIKELTLTANKVRQETITTELMEIIGGAEAVRSA
jgi:F-type H+-transporting ATPase subunit gamma